MTLDAIPEHGLDFGHAYANFAVHTVLGIKTEKVCSDAEFTATAPSISVFRKEELITWILADEVNETKGLEAAHLGIMGFGADEVIVVFDARIMMGRTKEEYDRLKTLKLQPGDMQRMAEEEGTDLTGVTVECMVLHHAKDGWLRLVTFPYLVRLDDDGTRHIEWLDGDIHSVTLEDAEAEGAILESLIITELLHFFEQQRNMMDLTAIGVTAMGMSEFESRMHCDMAIIKIATDANFHLLYNADTPEKRAILKGSTDHGVLSDRDMEYAGGGEINDEGQIVAVVDDIEDGK